MNGWTFLAIVISAWCAYLSIDVVARSILGMRLAKHGVASKVECDCEPCECPPGCHDDEDEPDHDELAQCIVDHLRTRNGASMRDHINEADSRGSLTEELSAILEHGGKPPNWV